MWYGMEWYTMKTNLLFISGNILLATSLSSFINGLKSCIIDINLSTHWCINVLMWIILYTLLKLSHDHSCDVM